MYHKFSTCMANEISQWVSTFEVNVNIIYFGSREMQELQKIRLDALWPDTQGLLGNLIWGKVNRSQSMKSQVSYQIGISELLKHYDLTDWHLFKPWLLQILTWWGSSSNKVHTAGDPHESKIHTICYLFWWSAISLMGKFFKQSARQVSSAIWKVHTT
jgi:hypothetical protein